MRRTYATCLAVQVKETACIGGLSCLVELRLAKARRGSTARAAEVEYVAIDAIPDENVRWLSQHPPSRILQTQKVHAGFQLLNGTDAPAGSEVDQLIGQERVLAVNWDVGSEEQQCSSGCGPQVGELGESACVEPARGPSAEQLLASFKVLVEHAVDSLIEPPEDATTVESGDCGEQTLKI
eukprot:CAMPEP_0113706228 /NCGR_PEP_ID=MMETSP0038_2-20120614/27599_1 /TAXON_ID=2898 /ORGANISM="Cryptomonas paramecium" /LENGTH=180 /DNA_ID=CAMNT_0000631379 /DNA_START=468 /DNA_END=1011 /DNA_ORIENTATION=- /assembly_acc=CAM_ASM_000170